MPRCQILALAMLLTLPLPAIAGKQEAELALTASRSNVAAAERAEAARYATIEMKAARDMLARAQGSFDARDWSDAELEAERSKADARLAETRARQRIAERQLAELEQTIQTLREEIARQGG